MSEDSLEPPTALITGVGGQDGTYLAELLIANGWSVHGLSRAVSGNAGALQRSDGLTLHYGDLASQGIAAQVVGKVSPDYVFHLAAISSVWMSWKDPYETVRINGLATAALLDACLAHQDSSGRPITLVHASSAEIFAGASSSPQHEETQVRPLSPYGASKALSHNLVQIYRSRGLKGSNAILYNHESPRRPSSFVTRKITMGAAAIAAGRQDVLRLGDLAIERDWGWAPDYVDALIAIAKHKDAEDFVIATGASHSIEQFVYTAFAAAGIQNWTDHVVADAAFVRPADSKLMIGDAAKADRLLGWRPTMTFEKIVAAMVAHDLHVLAHPPGNRN